MASLHSSTDDAAPRSTTPRAQGSAPSPARPPLRSRVTRVLERRRRHRNAELITDARQSLQRDFKHRRVVYSIMQGSRIPCLLLSFLTYVILHNVPLSGVLFVVSALLPWVSVVIANGHGVPPDKKTPRVYKPAYYRQHTTDPHAPSLGSTSQQAELTDGRTGGTGSERPSRVLPAAHSVDATDCPPPDRTDPTATS